MSEWAGRRVLVTGASGFIGSHLTQRLIDDGASVRVLVRDPGKLIAALRDRVEVISGDLLQPDCFAPATRDIDTVFHVAAWLGRPARYDAAYAVNVTATRQLAEAARANDVRRLVHTSSIAVYGPVAEGVVTEDSPHRPVYAYAETKSLSEQAALDAAADQLEVAILRPAMVYGPRSSAWTITPVRLAQRRLPVLIGDGRGFSHPVYVDNLIDAYLLAATRPQAVGEAFTISDGDVEWRDFFGQYARLAGRRAYGVSVTLARSGASILGLVFKVMRRPSVISRASVGFMSGRARLNTDKAQRMLGWSPRISFDEGMRRTEHWLKETGMIRAA